MAKVASTKSTTKRGGIGAFMVAALLVSAVAGGLGFLLGGQIRHMLVETKPVGPRLTAAKIESEASQVVTLPAIVTNLAGGDGAGWIRLEAAVIVEGKSSVPSDLAARLAQDTTALLRTLTARQITGASGFQHLREELLDRMRTRSADRVREIVILSLVIE